MRIFRRGPSEPEATGDFWTWWSGGHDRVAQAIATGSFDERLVEGISRAVRTIHPAMAWELAPGRTARHAFCISPEGSAEIRQAALRWLAAAPPADETWEYHASKQAAPSLMGLEVSSWRFDLEETRAITSWDGGRRRVDVRLWHPRFPEVPEGVKLQVGFLFLDRLLGEDDVERWIGEIDLLEAPTGGRTPVELKAEVERRKREVPGNEGWVLAERTGPGGQVEIVLADAALKRIDHPFADHHVEIAVVLEGAGGLPDDAEASVLNAEQDDLIGRLEGIAVCAGRTTTRGQRTMHFVAEDPDRMRPAIDAWAADLHDSLVEGSPPRRIKVNFERDMNWSFQKGLGLG